MFFVYYIKSIEGLHYVGSTNDLNYRIHQHNSGISRWTKRGTNWKLMYSESFLTRAEAEKREKWLKSGVGRDFLKALMRQT